LKDMVGPGRRFACDMTTLARNTAVNIAIEPPGGLP
jgi:hypothetical protein